MSFWDILQSKLLSYFLAYLGQFKSKSHIQGHPQKVENQGFHLTQSLMGFQALLLEILALKKGTNLFNRAYRLAFYNCPRMIVDVLLEHGELLHVLPLAVLHA